MRKSMTILSLFLSAAIGLFFTLLYWFVGLSTCFFFQLACVILSVLVLLLTALFAIANRDVGCCCRPLKYLFRSGVVSFGIGFMGLFIPGAHHLYFYALLFLTAGASVFSFVSAVRLLNCCSLQSCFEEELNTKLGEEISVQENGKQEEPEKRDDV